MRSKTGLIVLPLITLLLLLSGFATDNPYFTIGSNDVEFNIPQGFPKPTYDFKNNKPTPAGFSLGRMLFYDPILSVDSSTSCGTCHQRIAAFAHIDHALSHGVFGLIGKRNVPPLQNLIWGKSYMWDGGVNNLEIQPISPISNPIEMKESLSNVIVKLQRSAYYRKAFSAAFGDSSITSERMLKALTQFTGLMISSNSRYDKFVRHEDTLRAIEYAGLKVFRSRCASCHREPLFTDESYKTNGLNPDTALQDMGRAIITGLHSDEYRFKVPSLRNVEMTYPYMHDGRFKTLQQVLDHYASGKYYSVNMDAELNDTKGMTDNEKKEILAFLKTLTDKAFLYDRRFADPSFQ